MQSSVGSMSFAIYGSLRNYYDFIFAFFLVGFLAGIILLFILGYYNLTTDVFWLSFVIIGVDYVDVDFAGLALTVSLGTG